MGAPDRKLALPHKPLLKEDLMLKIVPDAEASANRLVRRRLVAAFRAEVDERVDERVGDGNVRELKRCPEITWTGCSDWGLLT